MTIRRRSVGVFAKLPEPGRVKTRLAEKIGPERAAELYAAFQSDVIEQIQAGDHDTVLYYTPDSPAAADHFGAYGIDPSQLWPQPEPADLGQRLQHFFTRALKQYDQAIAIGTDSPTLPAEYVAQAWELLDQYEVVLGPATDGGYVLIGMSRLATEAFEAIDWSSQRVLLQTVQRLEKSHRQWTLLPPWYDIDEAADLSLLYVQLQSLRAGGAGEGGRRTTELLNRLWPSSSELEDLLNES